jgi:site-specific recombinase XerD
MIMLYVERPYTARQYHSSLGGEHLDGFAQRLHSRGYAKETAMLYLRAAMHLIAWMGRRRLKARHLDERQIEGFRRHLASCRCREPRRPKEPRGKSEAFLLGSRRFLEYLRDVGVAKPRGARVLPAVIADFCEWMQSHRGSAERTLVSYRRTLMAFLRMSGGDLARLNARGVRGFLLGHARRHGNAAAQDAAGQLRMFLRYLITQGRCSAGLDRALPSIATWRKASLPKYLPSRDVERIIRATPPGSRDRAVVLLLARLGLRRGDIAELRIGDIDWRNATIRVSGKTRREAKLPLPQDVGEAILAYLQDGRPWDVASDKVFFLSIAPIKPITSHSVSGIVRWAIRRSGIKAPPTHGCHLLRHSVATEMLRKGLSLQQIGLILRHRFIETTEQYAKVDVEALRAIAQPWPVRP